jgi:uncharacterized protein (TIGR04222 family)
MMLKSDAAVNVWPQTVSKCLPDAEELMPMRRVGHVITAIFGMNGADFLTYYVLLIVLLWLAAWCGRRWLAGRDGHRGMPLEQEPYLVAYLNDGPKLAVFAALASLRVAGLIETRDKLVARTRPDPPAQHRHPLEQAILDELAQPLRTSWLATRAPVRHALDQVLVQLHGRGLLADSRRQRQARLFGLLMVPVVALGVLRLLYDDVTGHPPVLLSPLRLLTELVMGDPMAYLVLAILAAIATGVRLWESGDNLPSNGRAKLDRLRQTYRYLVPQRRRPWESTLAAALSVALFGSSALWAVDPAFANDLDAPRVIGWGASESIIPPWDRSGVLTAWPLRWAKHGGWRIGR